MDGDWQPNYVEEEVQQDNASCDAEDGPVGLRAQVVHANGQEQDDLGTDPLNGTELDVVNVRRERQAEDIDLGKQEVRRGLTVGCDERGPRSRAPPGDDEAEEPSVALASRFGSPEVDRASCWQSRAYFGEDGGGDEDEKACDDIA